MPAMGAEICHGVTENTEINEMIFSVLSVTPWQKIFIAGMARPYGTQRMLDR